METVALAPGKTSHQGLVDWVNEVTRLCQPDNVVWCDGSEEEYQGLCQQMVESGTFTRLNEQKRPNSFLARSHPSDVARVEERTFICSRTREHAGPTNNWANPNEMKEKLRGLFNGSMRGRTLYVVPYAMGPLESPI